MRHEALSTRGSETEKVRTGGFAGAVRDPGIPVVAETCPVRGQGSAPVL